MIGRIDVFLRTRHAAYLRRLANREDVSLSRAFAMVVEDILPAPTPTNSPAKVRAKMVICPENLAVLDKLARDGGISRSDVARRLIDEAMASEGN
jgi:hypothetical protein